MLCTNSEKYPKEKQRPLPGAIADDRNSPLESINLSPAQLYLGLRLKSNLPAKAAALKPDIRGSVKNN